MICTRAGRTGLSAMVLQRSPSWYELSPKSLIVCMNTPRVILLSMAFVSASLWVNTTLLSLPSSSCAWIAAARKSSKRPLSSSEAVRVEIHLAGRRASSDANSAMVSSVQPSRLGTVTSFESKADRDSLESSTCDDMAACTPLRLVSRG